MAACHFLLVYDLREGRLISTVQFEDAAEAVAAYQSREREHLIEPHVEIVLVAADSIETVHETHGSYFDEGVSSVWEKYVREILPVD